MARMATQMIAQQRASGLAAGLGLAVNEGNEIFVLHRLTHQRHHPLKPRWLTAIAIALAKISTLLVTPASRVDAFSDDWLWEGYGFGVPLY